MSSISRKKLPKGTKLYTTQSVRPCTDAATALSGAIAPEQLTSNKSTFRLNFHIPYIDSSFWATRPEAAALCYSIPFTLTPLQDNFQTSASTPRVNPATFLYSPSAPRFYLDEISFGFDQRDESAAIADRFFDFTAAVNGVQDSRMNFEGVVNLNLQLAVYEHEMTHWDVEEDIPTSRSLRENIGKEIWGVKVPNVAFAGKDHRLNPLLVDSLDIELSPHRSYIFAIYADQLTPELVDNKPSFALPGVTVSLKIKSDLVERETALDAIQNIPTKSNGTPTNATVTTTTPAAGAVIIADGAGGVSDNLAIIDKEFRDGLKGGYDDNSETATNQNLSTSDSGYEVIAVPLFQNRRYQVVTDLTVPNEPYYNAAAAVGAQFISDRRIIPIHYPFVLHHVMLAFNWQTLRNRVNMTGAATTFEVPSSGTLLAEVGVGMATGLSSDLYTYEQLARLTMKAPDFFVNSGAGVSTWHDRCIDRIRCFSLQSHQGHARSSSAGNPYWWDWEIMNVPLEGTLGNGYFQQGKPIFIGKAWSPTWTRTNMEVPAAVASTAGGEQFIEVRMQYRDTTRQLAQAPLTYNENLLSGYQGHWVYLIGKKAVL